MPLLVAAPIVLLLRGKLPLMVSPGLTCRERLGDRQHGEILVRLEFDRPRHNHAPFGCDAPYLNLMYKKFEDDPAFSFEATIAFVDSLQQNINNLSIFTRRGDYYTFDLVAGEAIAKAFTLCRAVIVLVQSGFPDEAFALCRSLFELSMYLRYITREPSLLQARSLDFLRFGVNAKGFWADLLNKSDSLTDVQRDEVERYKSENKIPDDPRLVTQPWSGVRRFIEKYSKLSHPTDVADSDEKTRDRDRALSYTDASSYVHCTQPGLDRYAYDWKEPIQLPKKNGENEGNISKICMVIHVHLRAVVRFSLYGLKVVPLDDFICRRHPASDIFVNPSLHPK
jgi:hypothetical protein